MLVWWSWAAAWASWRKRCKCLASNVAANGRHLQRHAPAQRQLDGLVDDAHAAAADLADDLEVAQRIGRQRLAGAAGQRAADRPTAGWPAAPPVHQLQAVQALAQAVGQIGITLQPLAAVGPPAGLQFAADTRAPPATAADRRESALADSARVSGGRQRRPGTADCGPSAGRGLGESSLMACLPSPGAAGPAHAPRASPRYPATAPCGG